MANTTNFNWETPDDTDLVKDGAAAIRTLGSSIDTSFVDLLGGTTGQVLSKTSGTDLDFTWIEQDDTTLSFNAQTGTTYTLTLPPSIFATGNEIHIQQIGVGQVTLAQGAGVTITSTGATASAPKLRARYSAATIICTASNTFTVVGDLS
jgi:hypothetical protein